MNKKLDCVEMKRKGSEILQKKIGKLSLEEELKFWQERTNALKENQLRLIKINKSRKINT
jgi:hypothetical protein